MMPKNMSTIKKILKKTGKGIVLLSLLLLLAQILIPFLSNHYLLPQICKNLPFTEQYLAIDSISPNRLSGQLVIKDTNNSVSLPRLTFHYNPLALFRGEIEQITINGLALHLQQDNGKLVLPRFASKNRQDQKTSKKDADQTVTIKKILLQNCIVFIEDKHKNTHKTVLINGAFSSLSIPFFKTQENFLGKISLTGDIVAEIDFSAIAKKGQQVIALQCRLPKLENVQSFLPRSFQLSGHGTVNATIHLDISSTLQRYTIALALPTAMLQYKTAKIVSREKIPLAIQLNGDTTKASFTVKNLYLAQQQINTDISGEINIPSTSIQGKALIHTPYSATPFSADFSANQKKQHSSITVKVKGKDISIKNVLLPNINLKTTAQIQTEETAGEINFTAANIVIGQDKLSSIHLSLPFQFPPKKTRKGKLSIAAIQHNSINLGTITGQLQQTPNGLTTNLLFATPLLEGPGLHCKGEAASNPFLLTTTCYLPSTNFASSNMPDLPNLDQPLLFSGKIGGKSKISVNQTGMAGSLQLAVKNGFLQQGNSILSGIEGAIILPDIAHIRSSPDQRLTIKRLSSGKISAEKAEIHWQLENTNTLFIEKAQLNWCGGKIETAGLRLSPDNTMLATTLYCDRLRLSSILEQFDIAQTTGQASLNGRLPLTLTAQGIDIENGFLFSTPGEKGIFHFTNTRKIKDSIPAANTSPYLEYSLQSLENFAYNWITLTFNSEGEDLLLTMKLDGKPAKPLPYKYKEGRIVPFFMEKNNQEGLQHPVRFDVNFHLPMQQMFKYGAGIQSAINNFKEKF